MKINKNQLQEALAIVQPGLASKDIIEQSNSFAFLDGKVITYNDRISITHPVPGLDIVGAIPSEELYKLLQKIKQSEIDIEIQKNEICLKFGKGSANLILQEKIKIPLIEIEGEWRKLPDDFNHLIKFAMASCSKDMSNPRLTCVNVCSSGVIQATDSYKITYCKLKKEIPVETFLISALSVKDVVKINPTHVIRDDKWVHFVNEKETVISCRLGEFEEEYPDLKTHIKIKGVQIEFPNSISELIDRAWVFAKRDNQLDEEITIKIENKRMIISSKSETGKFSEKVFINYEGTPIEFLISPYLLIDIFKDTNRCELNENVIKFEGEGWQYVSVLQSEE